MDQNFKVAVLGPIPRDRITTHQGQVFEKYGCVLYTVAALSALLGDKGTIVPVTGIRKRDEEPIKEILSRFSNVDTSAISTRGDRGDIVHLTYTDQNHRIERQTGFMDPILIEDVESVLDADAVVCVPITDYEVSRATLRHIKENSNAIVLLDAHGPTNALARTGERFHRFWVERDSWLPYIDILKMNLEEAGCSWFASEYEAAEMDSVGLLAMDELPKFAEHCLDRGVKALCVTLDQHGCAIYYRNAAGKTREHIVKRIPVDQVVDTTGCGDSFAGGMIFGYLKHGDFIRACQYGNAMGAQRCAGSQLAIYKSLEETERQIADAYDVP